MADSDHLYPPSHQAELTASIAGADDLRVIESLYGHDGFLVELDQVATLVGEIVP